MLVSAHTLTPRNVIDALSVEPGRRLYHSVQLRDFETYLQVGAIICREDLFKFGPQHYTQYDSDRLNGERGRLDKIFLNLGDHAWSYRFLLGVPDVYGPIHLELDLATLEEFPAITIRRDGVGGAPGIIEDTAELVGLYHPDMPDRLRSDVKGEIEGHGRRLSLVRLRRVTVMPLTYGGIDLASMVRTAVADAYAGQTLPEVATRDVLEGHMDRLVEWAEASRDLEWELSPLPAFVTLWMREIAEHRRSRELPFDPERFVLQLRRYARYIEHGTLSRMRGEDGFLH